MGAVRNLTVALSDEVAAELDGAVANGEYETTDEVVRAALDAWWRGRTATGEDSARLRQLWLEGLASGTPTEVTDDWFEEVKRRGKKRLAAVRSAD